jgi:hypothetical protein
LLIRELGEEVHGGLLVLGIRPQDRQRLRSEKRARPVRGKGVGGSAAEQREGLIENEVARETALQHDPNFSHAADALKKLR